MSPPEDEDLSTIFGRDEKQGKLLAPVDNQLQRFLERFRR